MNLIKQAIKDYFKDVSFFFRWYDLWIGAYIDVPNKTLYVIPFPMFGVKIKL